MATITRLDNTSFLNTGAAWNGGVAPGTGDVATWNGVVTNVNTALGGSVSWGGIAFTSLQTTTINFGASGAPTLTLGADGINLSTSGASFAIPAGISVALAATQAWTVASGRTLTVSGAVSGNAKNLTLSGAGTKTLSGASTGWTNSTVTVSAGQATTSNINGLGASSNAVVVSADANLTVSAAIAPTAISISGDGFTGGTGYGAFTSSNALASANIITLATDGTVLTVNIGSAAFAAQIAGSVSTFTLNVGGSNTNTTFSAASSYTTSSDVRLQSRATNGTTANTGRYSFGTANNVTDASTSTGGGFGNSANNVTVEQTGCLVYLGAVQQNKVTLNRAYTFLASASPTSYQAAINALGLMDFAGTVSLDGSAGQAVYWAGANTYGAFDYSAFKLSGSISGAPNLWVGAKGIAGLACGITLGASLSSSSWSGTLFTDAINYESGTSGHVFPLVLRGPSANTTYINASGAASSNHSSYARETGTTVVFNPTSVGQTGSLTLGGGGWSSSPGTWQTDAGTLTLNFSFNGTAGALTKSGVSTLVLGGNNTAFTGVSWSAGALTLNSAGSAGPAAATFTQTSTGVLDSTVGATLTQAGANALNANFTWKGTASLTFGAGNVTTTGPRVITLANTGENGTLKFSGGITTTLATTDWNFGGSTAGAKQRITLGGANASLVAGTAADQPAVTAGYFRIENNNGLGTTGTTTTWWVGATNAGTQTTKAALELAGVTTPSTKNVNLYNIGPNDDGALIGASGTSSFVGSIAVPNALVGARIGAKSGATLTLDPTTYPNLNPANSGTPLSFTAESGGTVNVDRSLGGGGTSNVGAVSVTNGSGTVVLSKQNYQTSTACSAGTTRVTHVNATGTGNVTVSAGATLESTVQSQFQATLSLGTLSSLSRAILKFAA